MKFSKVNSKVSNFQEQEDGNLMKVEIMIQHDGLNRNNSFFELDNIKKAETSLRNIPILGYIRKEDDDIDFDQHNMNTKLIEGENGYELQVEYLESPIGVIPSDTDVRYEEIDGRTYLICNGYIWANYCKDAADIINAADEKKVSMEISVNSYSLTNEGYVNIEDYQFLGLTILGDHVESGMIDTVLTKYSQCSNYKKSLEEIYQEIYKLKEKEDGDLSKPVEPVVEEQPIEPVTEEPVTDNQDPIEPIQEFALSVDNIRVSINSQLKDRTVEAEDWWGDKYQKREFYLFDILPSENIAVVEDNLNYYNYYGIPYEIQGDNAVLKYDKKVSYIQEWRPKNEGEEVVVFEKEDELKDVVMAKFTSKETEIETIKTDLSNLQEFKSKIDLEELKGQVEEVSNKYELDVDTTELKEKAITKDITLEQFEKELKVLFAEKILGNNKFSKEVKEEVAKVAVYSNDEEPELYGGLFSKHGLK